MKETFNALLEKSRQERGEVIEAFMKAFEKPEVRESVTDR